MSTRHGWLSTGENGGVCVCSLTCAYSCECRRGYWVPCHNSLRFDLLLNLDFGGEEARLPKQHAPTTYLSVSVRAGVTVLKLPQNLPGSSNSGFHACVASTLLPTVASRQQTRLASDP